MTPCQEWDGARSSAGYGQIRFGGKVVFTHRLAWALHNGADPTGKVVRHKCDNPPCLNPEHLEIGTQKDNAHDTWSRGRGNPVKYGKRVKFSLETIGLVRGHLASGMKQRLIAAKFGMSQAHVSEIKLGTVRNCGCQ